jgi:hypothetical protein
MLEKTKGPIKNGQFKETVKLVHTTKEECEQTKNGPHQNTGVNPGARGG